MTRTWTDRLSHLWIEDGENRMLVVDDGTPTIDAREPAPSFYMGGEHVA